MISGLAAMIKSNQEPITRIGDTWRQGGSGGRQNDEFKSRIIS